MLPLGQQEKQFFLWVGNRPDVVAQLVNLPPEIFSDEGRRVWETRSWPEVNGTQPSEADALRFLRTQALSLLGREAGRAQKSLTLDRVRSTLEIVEQCFDSLQKPPIEPFEALVPKQRSVIPTGIEAIDQQILGISPGDLGIVAMPTGYGKTCLLINLCVSALFQGYRVLYITVADASYNELVPRIDTCILETPIGPSPTEETLARRHHEAIKQIKGQLLIADYTDRECTISAIEQLVHNNKADLVLVDHADDICPVGALAGDLSATRHSLRIIYSSLKKLAQKANVGLWTASQTHEWSWRMPAGSTNELAEAKLGKSSGAAIVLLFTGGDNPQPGSMNCTIAKARRCYTQRTFRVNIDHPTVRVW